MKFACPHCGQHLECDTIAAGRVIRCPNCKEQLAIPSAYRTSWHVDVSDGASRRVSGDASGRRPTSGPEADTAEELGEEPKIEPGFEFVPAQPEDERAPAEAQAPPAPQAKVGIPLPGKARNLTSLRQTLQSHIDRASMTITQYMAKRKMEGGVQLDESGSGGSASGILTAEQGRKYTLGDMVTHGGMGAILDARDVNIRRHVAMKVLLSPERATKDDVLRFIEEAQVTGQLEHSNIVPVHELGIDAGDNVFYTMKFINGRTLKEILTDIRDGNEKTLAEYPLSRLLNVFQRVCDAVAFAHSRRVLHRDLKPENVMVGEYGEVQVMDWGLAKLLPKKPAKKLKVRKKDAEPPPPKEIETVIDSVRKGGDILHTQTGAIMGTPGFMAPEQALGHVEEIDTRTDVYALGAILYNILTLDPPIQGENLGDVIKKVTAGEIRHPSEYNVRTRKTKRRAADDWPALGRPRKPREKGPEVEDDPLLRHCPGGTIPDSLSAVAMKALSVKPIKRYGTVKDLQGDIEAYQNGFTTSAEHAGFRKVLTLFLKRHKAVSVATTAALLVLAAVVCGFVLRLENQKVIAFKALEDFRKEQAARVADRKKSAPALVESARTFIEQKKLDIALNLSQTATEYDPGLAEARMLLALMRVQRGEFSKALGEAEQYARLKPNDSEGKQVLSTCRIAALQGREAAPLGGIVPICNRWGITILGGEFSRSSDEKLAAHRARIEKAWPALGARLSLAGDGSLQLDLSECKQVESLLPLEGIPLAALAIGGSDRAPSVIPDLAPLKGMPLTSLSVRGTQIADLSPLKWLPLISLSLNSERDDGMSPISDLSPLRGMQLASLSLWNCQRITDITPLRGMPLTNLVLRIAACVMDLSALKGMPLTRIELHGSCAADLIPLRGQPLTSMVVVGDPERPYLTSVRPLKGMPLATLSLIRTGVSDLAPLKGLPLEILDLNGSSRIADLAPLQGMPLKSLGLQYTGVADLTPLRGLSLTSLAVGYTKVADLSPLKEIPLARLNIEGCSQITDLSPLRGMKSLAEVAGNRQLILSRVKEALSRADFDAVVREANEVSAGFQHVPAFAREVQWARALADSTVPALRPLQKDPSADLSRLPAWNGHHFLAMPDVSMKWKEAKAFCEALHGHLAVITGKEEQEWIASTFSGAADSFLLGGACDQKERKWTWVTGERWEYTNWAKGQPDNYYNAEFSLCIVKDGGWYDVNGEGPRPFIIEWDR